MRFGMWKRATVAAILLLFLVGAAGQAVSQIFAAQPCVMGASAPDDILSLDHDPLTRPVHPICINMTGCVVSVSVPTTLAPDSVGLDWSTIRYWELSPVLSGWIPGPELDPPILV